MGLKAVGAHRLPGGLRVGAIFEQSFRVGRTVRGRRERMAAAPLGGVSLQD
jgi:hypothetical protein